MEDKPKKMKSNTQLKYPYTYLSKITNNYREFLTNTCSSYDIYKKNKAQQRDIENIRDILEKRKSSYLCHLNERMAKEKSKKQTNYNKIVQERNIDVKNSNIKLKIANKLNERTKLQRSKIVEQKRRMIGIVKKILREQKRQDQIDAQKNKTYFDIVKRKKRPKTVSVEEEETYQEAILDEFVEEEWEEIETDIPQKAEKSVPIVVTRQVKKQNEKKKSNQIGSSPRPKSSKMTKKEFTLPPIPNTNPRERIPADAEIELKDLMQSYAKSNTLIESHDAFRKPEETFPYEYGFSWKPKTVLFDNFETEKIYSQRITIVNNGPEAKVCMYWKMVGSDGFRESIIEVEPFSTQKVIPGMSFSICIYFKPENDFKDFNGEIIFLAYKSDSEFRYQFEIPFECIRPKPEIVINPENIVFSKIPFWELKRNVDKLFAHLEIENSGTKPCKIIVRKENIEDIQSIELIEHLEKMSSVHGEETESVTGMINEILNICLQNIHSIFSFDTYILDLGGRSKASLRVQFNNASYVGMYFEKYVILSLDHQNGNWGIVDQKEILVQGEVTGKYIVPEYQNIDFGICVLNSAYQEAFKVKNEESFPVNIVFQLPPKFKDFVSILPPNASLKGNEEFLFCIKFMSRKELLDNPYYDPLTKILNFPIKICLLSPENNVPPTIVSVFAILTKPNEVFLKPLMETPFFHEADKTVINLGKVGTHETVLCDFEIENLTEVEQEYGFLNLPKFVNIEPNYGFGVLQPGEVRRLTLHFAPTIWNIPTKYGKQLKCNEIDSPQICFNIKCNTLPDMGALKESEFKKRRNPKKEEKRFIPRLSSTASFSKYMSLKYEDLSEEQVETFEEEDNLFYPGERTSASKLKSLAIAQEEEKLEEEHIAIRNTNILYFTAQILDNWCELSHQYVLLPHTAMGSYSIYSTFLNGFNQSSSNECVCGYLNGKKITEFRSKFEFFGGTDEIMIEPTCGDLNSKESVKITLIAKPKMDEDIVREKAEIYKIFRSQKEQAESLINKKRKIKNTPLDQKRTPKTNLDAISAEPNNTDLYNAEKELWRFVEPFEISAKFTCVVTFQDLKEKQKELLSLEVKCIVTKPQFILNIDTPLLNFRCVNVGSLSKMELKIENISDEAIAPKISSINPAGPFDCFLAPTVVEREHVLTVQVLMAPTTEQAVQENLEISCGSTRTTVVLRGEGVLPDFEVKPSFVVCRLNCKLGGHTNCAFTIVNKCRSVLNIQIIKLFELEGLVVPVPPELLPEALGKGTGSARNKMQQKKPKRMTNDLTENEYYSLSENLFMKFENDPKFTLIGEDKVAIAPFGKLNIRIKFELPKRLLGPTGKEKREGDFVTKYKILLDKTTIIYEFFIIGSIRR